MNNRLYMYVSADEYELPFGVFDNLDDMARVVGLPKRTIQASLWQHKSGRVRGYKFISVQVEED